MELIAWRCEPDRKPSETRSKGQQLAINDLLTLQMRQQILWPGSAKFQFMILFGRIDKRSIYEIRRVAIIPPNQQYRQLPPFAFVFSTST